MSIGKYISLEEARKDGKLERFAAEHPSTGDEPLFDGLLGAMVEGPPPEKKSEKDKPA